MAWWWQPLASVTAAVAEPETVAAHLVRIPFRAFGRNPYLHRTAQDDSAPVIPEADTLAQRLVRIPLRPLGRNPYLRHYAQDDSFVPPPEASTFAQHAVRRPFRPFGRNPYVRNPSIEGPTQLNDASSGHLVVPNWDGFRGARVSRYLYRPAFAADTSAPVVASTWEPFLVRVPFKRFGRNPYLRHGAQDTSAVEVASTWAPFLVRVPFKRFGRNPYTRHSAHDESFVGPTFNPAWAKNANVLVKAGLLR